MVVSYGADDSHGSADGLHTMTHYKLWVAYDKAMSNAGLGLREEPLYEGTLEAWELGMNHLFYEYRDGKLNPW